MTNRTTRLAALIAAPAITLTLAACSAGPDAAQVAQGEAELTRGEKIAAAYQELAAEAAKEAETEAPDAGTALTGATVAPEYTPDPAAVCGSPARYDIYKQDGGEWKWAISGGPIETGASTHAAGTVDSSLTRYTVAPGDTLIGIGERFCIDYIHLSVINDLWGNDSALRGGETIRLYPAGDASEFVSEPPA